ncbi:MAG: conjugative transposon protein TraK [Chitinophagaceae bacterium]
MFQPIQDIHKAFKTLRNFSLILVIGSLLLSAWVMQRSFQLADQSRQKIYLLAEGKVLMAYASDRRANLEVEARDDIRMFHHDFFTLDPDDEVIEKHMTRALYLSDGSAKSIYDNGREKGYYAAIIAANISQRISMDSIRLDMSQYPYFFLYYGTEKVIRTSGIQTRNLVTEGYLREVSRSDHNPHGFLIQKWQILNNQDLPSQNH